MNEEDKMFFNTISVLCGTMIVIAIVIASSVVSVKKMEYQLAEKLELIRR